MKKFLPFSQIAGPRTCRSFRLNLPLSRENKLVGGPSKAFTKDNNTSSPFPTVFQAQTLASALAPIPPSNEELFQ